MPKVCIIRCDSYDRNQVQEAIVTVFQEFGAERYFQPNEKILLKPNLLSAKTPDKAVTTHPEVFRAVASVLQGYHVNLSYGDSPGFDTTDKAEKICGIEEVADELSIPKADFTNAVQRDFPQGVLVRKFQFVKAIDDTDGIISICKFKTHALTRFTGAMKNQFGLIPGILKAKEHVRFPTEQTFTQMIADLNGCIRPRLFVMDGIVGMEGNGPANGTPRLLGLLMVSDDPVALDSVCIGMIGLDHAKVPLTTNAQASGTGIADPARIDLCLIETRDGAQSVRWDKADKMIPLLKIPDFINAVTEDSAMTRLTTRLGPLAKQILLNRPTVIHSKCTKCKRCVQVCPVEPKAIEFSASKQKIIYHYSRCIRCFCCQELCPYAAIVVKKAPLSFFMKGR